MFYVYILQINEISQQQTERIYTLQFQKTAGLNSVYGINTATLTLNRFSLPEVIFLLKY
jgi:hypothetical protein